MLSKSTVVPPAIALYNQGNIDGRIVQGTVGPVVASDELNRKWESAHRERGKTWKNA
jgi:hypothetical protein